MRGYESYEDVFDTSAICVQAQYNGQEFFRCSFYCTHFNQNDPNDRTISDSIPLRRALAPLSKDSIIMRDIDWNYGNYNDQISSNDLNQIKLIKEANMNLFGDFECAFSGANFNRNCGFITGKEYLEMNNDQSQSTGVEDEFA